MKNLVAVLFAVALCVVAVSGCNSCCQKCACVDKCENCVCVDCKCCDHSTECQCKSCPV